MPAWVIWALGGAFVAGLLLTGYLVFSMVRGLASAWTGTGPAPFSFVGGNDPQAAPEVGAPAVVEAAQPAGPTWNGVDRVNLLLMGLDYRDWSEGDGPPRTDSMMLVSVDPVTKVAGMLSIPRDLWVEIPGFEHNRINTAYFLGETYELPGGGPALAAKTVESLLGVPVTFYAVIDFRAFERMVDEIGGVEVKIEEEVKICPIGQKCRWLYPSSKLLNGSDALAYARARKTEGGDFDRAQRQQQVAMAIRDKILNLNMLPSLLAKAPALYQEFASGIRTNLSFDQMISLGTLALQLPKESIRRGVIAPPDMVTLETLPTGAEVLRPIPSEIRRLRDALFAEASAVGPAVPVDQPVEAAKVESPRVRVLNGSGVEGLATKTADYLTSQGITVVAVGNADRLDYEKSRVFVHNSTFPYTLRFLAEMLGLSQGQILSPVTPSADIDLDVVLGADWAYAAMQGAIP
jgi:LCP family protein required for cell wall assembly